ncbi:hypothetical protein HYU89_02965 [Candidatus Collierbacteria bacterium]|nr:hypothetical protein [Candidatus Collierbacteria bacterium]
MARYEGKIVRALPEYDDCKKTAAEKKVSIQTVIDSVRDIVLSTLFHN